MIVAAFGAFLVCRITAKTYYNGDANTVAEELFAPRVKMRLAYNILACAVVVMSNTHFIRALMTHGALHCTLVLCIFPGSDT